MVVFFIIGSEDNNKLKYQKYHSIKNFQNSKHLKQFVFCQDIYDAYTYIHYNYLHSNFKSSFLI